MPSFQFGLRRPFSFVFLQQLVGANKNHDAEAVKAMAEGRAHPETGKRLPRDSLTAQTRDLLQKFAAVAERMSGVTPVPRGIVTSEVLKVWIFGKEEGERGLSERGNISSPAHVCVLPLPRGPQRGVRKGARFARESQPALSVMHNPSAQDCGRRALPRRPRKCRIG